MCASLHMYVHACMGVGRQSAQGEQGGGEELLPGREITAGSWGNIISAQDPEALIEASAKPDKTSFQSIYQNCPQLGFGAGTTRIKY